MRRSRNPSEVKKRSAIILTNAANFFETANAKMAISRFIFEQRLPIFALHNVI